MTSRIDAETIATYDARAADYAARFARDAHDPRLEAFIAGLPKGGQVLDLGCGPCHAAARMREAGLQVTALDASAEMARVAHDLYGITVQIGGFDAVRELRAYDGIWANFSLLHAPRAEMPAHLAALHRALRPAGRFHIGMKTGTGEMRDSIGRLYTYYTDAELSSLLADAGFTVDGRATGSDAGLDGTTAPWIILGAHA